MRLIAALLLATPLLADAAQKLVLGVFAFRPKQIMVERYQPLADYLSAQLPDTRVELRVLEQDELEQALAQHQLDLVLTNPSHYLIVRSRDSLGGVLATVISREDGAPVESLGGVIIARAERKDVNSLADLRGQRIGIPGRHYLGGFQTQALEMLEAGLDPERGVEYTSLGRHDSVVTAVLEGMSTPASSAPAFWRA